MKTGMIVVFAWLSVFAPHAALAQDATQTNGAPAETNTPSESQPAPQQGTSAGLPTEAPKRTPLGGTVIEGRLMHFAAGLSS